MAKVLAKETLSQFVKKYVVEAPLIAKKCRPGQFVMLRLHEQGERFPLTIADFNRTAGTITLIVQEVGNTTREMGGSIDAGSEILDVLGPLGQPSEIENFGTVICVGGGIGIAPVYPIARAYKEAGNKVISILGARCKDLLIYEAEMRAVSDEVYITTDDGSYGEKGFVTDPLKRLLSATDTDIKRVMAIGPVIMMKNVAETTRPFGVPTIASLNTIMVDGTGMCGGCRVSVGGDNKFACVDGPEFDAHLVDFKNLVQRQQMYKTQEAPEYSCGGQCKCLK